MPLTRLKEFLDDNGVRYISIRHSPAYTAQEIAASAHIPGKELAKTVIVTIFDNSGGHRMAMAVLPASYRIDFELLKQVTGARRVELATEEEFKDLFPACDVGAMPPFGNLYDMDVFVASALTEDEEIAFCGGSHCELIKLAYADYSRLVEPVTLHFEAAYA